MYQCKDGFILKGDNTTKCDFGNWTGNSPICELVYCPFPGYIEGGKVCKILYISVIIIGTAQCCKIYNFCPVKALTH